MRRWTRKEKQFLKENRKTMTNQQIADELGRSINGVQNMIGKMKIQKKRGGHNFWTDTEDNTVRLNYGKFSCEDIGRAIGRTAHAVQLRASMLGLSKRTRKQVMGKVFDRNELANKPILEEPVLKATITKEVVPSYVVNTVIALSTTIVVLAVALFMILTWVK